ncbi:hypothetical protein [Neotabrizicola sp. sgz301269]|uniref:hypothetical protein n=1 Tax=Neotabrizicola sp. sgz301269 TaxID=3276282 RepID=UPI003770712D
MSDRAWGRKGRTGVVATGRTFWLTFGLVLALALSCLAQGPLVPQRLSADSVQRLTLVVSATLPNPAKPQALVAPQSDPGLPGPDPLPQHHVDAARPALPGAVGPQKPRLAGGDHWPRAPPVLS